MSSAKKEKKKKKEKKGVTKSDADEFIACIWAFLSKNDAKFLSSVFPLF